MPLTAAEPELKLASFKLKRKGGVIVSLILSPPCPPLASADRESINDVRVKKNALFLNDENRKLVHC